MKNKDYNICYIVKISFFATIAGLLFGFDTGIISGALQFIMKTFSIPKKSLFIQEIIVSSVPIGAFLGACFSNLFSNIYGRRNSIILTSFLFILGTILASFSTSVTGVIIGRLFMGSAVGLSAMVVPMYLSEVAPSKIRGAIVFCFQLAITIGLFVAFLINYLFSSSGNWRLMFLTGLVPSIILGIGMFFLPYSPRWLVMKNRNKQALEVLKRLNSKDNVDKEFKEIHNSIHSSLKKTVSKDKYRDIFKLSSICFLLFGFQQLSGINTIMYYAPIIYQHAGFDGSQGQILASLADGIAFILSTILGVWSVDKIGRRKLFFIGFTGIIICLLFWGILYQNIFPQQFKQMLGVISVVFYIIFFGISLGPLCYLMMSELFPLNLRGVGMAIASCGNWGFNVLVSSTFLTMIELLTISYTFFLYAFFSCLGLIFCYFFVPETKGITLEKIEKNLYSGVKIRHLGKSS